eukprot:TRINITY_DN6725_c0_g1_i10.p1 TRINITY_DN6725_c0_g1~~TRINITY_DN6725_c0_g1_i10.p1  ORF type:complete len:197 (+),score=20.72 TRINITY_DN6725_c0_g1_i10:189-779(+)
MKVSNVELWEMVAQLLSQAVSNLHVHSPPTSPSTPFDALRIPHISVRDYIERMRKYSGCSDSCYVLCFIYIDKLLLNNESFGVSMRNAHRVILAGLVLAIKYLDDIYADNSVFARIGGISLNELNILEAEMIRLLNFDLHVGAELYFQYLCKLHLHHQKLSEETMTDCVEENTKPIRYSGSVASMKTFVSTEDVDN